MTRLWTFTSLVPSCRRDELLAAESLREIVNGMKAGSAEFVGTEGRTNPPFGFRRTFFRLRVCRRHCDAFFNSPVGYRAQFCVGIENGDMWNRKVLAALTPMCLASVRAQALAVSSIEFVIASLAGAGAKIWIDEAALAGLDGIHIDYKPWVLKYQAATDGSMADQEARSLAFGGVLAPIGTCLEIKGGWINSDGREWRDPIKANRSYEIRDYGFT